MFNGCHVILNLFYAFFLFFLGVSGLLPKNIFLTLVFGVLRGKKWENTGGCCTFSGFKKIPAEYVKSIYERVWLVDEKIKFSKKWKIYILIW